MTAMWANIQKYWNVYATADANGQTWGTATLTLNLKNAEASTVNFWSCTLELPEGVTFESASLISTRCPEGSEPNLIATPNADGTVAISCELEENYAFTGTDGAVAAVTVAIAGDAPLGTCVVNVKNIVVSRTDGSEVNIPRKEFIWTIESIYTLIFDTNGSSEIASITQAVGTPITPPEAPTREGYTFMGWEPAIPETMPAGDMTVVAQWRINSYSLTYKVDGEVYKNYEVEYGSTITPESAPAKEGYTFSGWSEIPETMPAEDVTVTGSFTINSYTLTYKVDGIVYKKISVEYGTALIPEPVPAKRGMTFSGWGKVPKTMPAKNVTLKGTFSWSKETIEGVVYQVTDTLSNSASVVGYDEASAEATVLSDVEIDGYMYEVNSFLSP